MAGCKRESPESERSPYTPSKKRVLTATRPTLARTTVEQDNDAGYSDDDDPYQTDEEPDHEALSLLQDLLQELTSDEPKHHSKADTWRLALQAIPPYLWRVAGSTKSRGLNTKDVIDPLYGKHNYGREYHWDISMASYTDMRDQVSFHLRWKYKRPSEFSSWTVSLLWMLVHAYRKYLEGEKDIIIYVIDTSKLPSTRIHKATDLVKKYDLEWIRQGQLEANAAGEYLIHGKLTNRHGLWRAVKFQDLLDAGFEKLFPELGYKPDLLHMRAIQLRHRWFEPNKDRKDIEKLWGFGENEWVLDSFRALAHCFGQDWEGMVMVALISLRRRDLNPEVMESWIPKAFDGMKMPQLPWDENPGLRAFHLSVRDLVDAHQFMLLLRMLHDRAVVCQREGPKDA